MDTSIQVAAMVVIASFTIERVAAGVFFILSLFDGWNRLFPDSAAESDASSGMTTQKVQKLAYYAFVAVLAAVIVWTFDIQVVRSLQLQGVSVRPSLDHLFSILVLLGGSDQIAELLKSPAPGKNIESATKTRPVEVTGTLTLDERTARALRTPAASRE